MAPDRAAGPGPLFETPVDRVLAAVPASIAGLLRQYLDEPLRAPDELRTDVHAYLAKLESLSADMEFLDLALARRIAAACEALLTGVGSHGSEDAHRLVQIAVRYFIEDDDDEGDTTSPIGFDDDAEVVDLIARELGREDVFGNGGDGS